MIKINVNYPPLSHGRKIMINMVSVGCKVDRQEVEILTDYDTNPIEVWTKQIYRVSPFDYDGDQLLNIRER